MNTPANSERDSVEVHRLVSRYRKMPDDGHGEWIGAPNNGGDVGDMMDTVEELNRLLIALHDAIRRPMGVVPDSAAKFYQANTELRDRHESATSNPNQPS